MRFEIHSFESIQDRAKQPFEANVVFISIGDPDASPPKLANKPAHILRLMFDDITLEEVRERFELPAEEKLSNEGLSNMLTHYNTILFDDTMADRVAAFVSKRMVEADLIICQCERGQSRSAACAAAMMEHFYGRGNDVFDDKRYSPNKLVYQKVLEALKRHAASKDV